MKTLIITISTIIQFTLLCAFAVAANITKPNTFTNGTIADANQVNANFDTVYTQTNNNTANINTLGGSVANAVTGFSTRTLSSGFAYNSSSAVVSNSAVTSCGTGEVITGGTCDCAHTSFSPTTTNFGVLAFCAIAGNSVAGACIADFGTTSTTKYGPPITTYAICASTTKTGSISLTGGTSLSKSVAKPAEEISDEQYQPELEAAIEKMKRTIEEYSRLRQGKNIP